MGHKFLAAVLAATLFLSLTACENAKTPPQTDPPQQTTEESWKTELAETLLENYGILPESYEDLGNGLYQVYAEVGGEVIPVGTADAATGAFFWN